jgi:hypothetical protein
VALLCHENLPFRGFIEIRSISSLPDAGQPLSCPVFLFTESPRRRVPGNLESGLNPLLRPNPLLNPRPALTAGSPI